MTHPLNPTPDPVAVALHQLAIAHGYDYVTALIASHETAKEVLDYEVNELAHRMLRRCAS